MKVAIIGSRGCSYVDIGAYLPNTTTEIISGRTTQRVLAPLDRADFKSPCALHHGILRMVQRRDSPCGCPSVEPQTTHTNTLGTPI